MLKLHISNLLTEYIEKNPVIRRKHVKTGDMRIAEKSHEERLRIILFFFRTNKRIIEFLLFKTKFYISW